jgi:hypothetical protein
MARCNGLGESLPWQSATSTASPSPGGVNFQQHILQVYGHGIIANEIPVQCEPGVLKDDRGIIVLDDRRDTIIAVEIGGHQHTAGAAGVVGNQLVSGQVGQCPFRIVPILFAADVCVMRLTGTVVARQQDRCLIDVPVHLIPVLEIKDGPQAAAGSHPGNDGSDHPGPPFEVIAAKKGIDESAFPRFDGTHHGHAHDLFGYLFGYDLAGGFHWENPSSTRSVIFSASLIRYAVSSLIPASWCFSVSYAGMFIVSQVRSQVRSQVWSQVKEWFRNQRMRMLKGRNPPVGIIRAPATGFYI